MNAQQIADRLVEQGILERNTGDYADDWPYVFSKGDGFMMGTADELIANWRTAGACLEVAMQRGIELDVGTELPLSLPAAICAAFAEVAT